MAPAWGVVAASELISSSAVSSGVGGKVGDATGSRVGRGVDTSGVAGMINRQPDISRVNRIKSITNTFDLGSISIIHGLLAEFFYQPKVIRFFDSSTLD